MRMYCLARHYWFDTHKNELTGGGRFGEQEVTEPILPVFDDYCTIHRLLVDVQAEPPRYGGVSDP